MFPTGPDLRGRMIAGVGALGGIALTWLLCSWLLPHVASAAALPLLVAPMGASAVLLFAVPASPLAQPWPIVGGNLVSALVGVAAARWIPHVGLAAGIAVGGAILAMSLLRCLHPPGGAAALTAVIGGPAVASAGFLFPFVPVLLNSVVLLFAGWLFNRLSGHSYPHRPAPPAAPAPPMILHPEDIDRALAETGETFDIARADLDLLLARAEAHATRRRTATPGG